MAAFQNLPWLNVQPGDFLHAITAGADDAMRRQSLMLSSQRSRPRGQQLITGAPAVDPREQAMADKITAETKLKEEQAAGANAAWDQYQSLTSRGATPQEAFEQSGLGRYDVKPTEAGMPSADKTFEIGNQVVKVNPETGNSSVIYSGPEKPVTPRRYAGPMALDALGHPAGTMSLTLPEWAAIVPSLPDRVRTNAPVANYANWAKTNSFTPPAIAAPAAPAAAVAPAGYKVPMGGYGDMTGGSAADFMAPARDAAPVQEVIRRTKSGRRAVYDANTKQFIRYAD